MPLVAVFVLFSTLFAMPQLTFAQAGAEFAQSGAERTSALRADINMEQQRLVTLRDELALRIEIFEKFTADGAAIEVQRDAIIAELDSTELGLEEAAARQLQVVELNERLAQEKRKTDLVFQATKATRTEIKVIESKLEKDTTALAKLLGEDSPDASGGDAPVTVSVDVPSVEPALPAKQSITGALPLAGLLPEPSAEPKVVNSLGKISLAETAQQIQARQQAAKLSAESLNAEQRLVEFVDLKEALQEQIRPENNQKALAQEAKETLNEELASIEKNIVVLAASGAEEEKLAAEQKRLVGVQEMLAMVAESVEGRVERLSYLRARMDAYENTQAEIFLEVEESRQAAEDARERSLWLSSAANPANIFRWARVRGPGILLVLGVMLVILFVIRFSARRVIRLLVKNASKGVPVRGQRADTLAASFSGVFTGIFVLITIMIILQEAGVDITTVLGGAAILGVAVAFGAQNLMRDYFNGVMILLEDQYGLNDLVAINGVEGRVERVNMRTTVVRDLEGRLHFIPNGSITLVTNRSYEWARAKFDIPVPYSCDVDRVMEILMDEANIFCQDMEYTPAVADKPEMLGVNEFAESAIIIRFVIKTVADMRLPVRREMLRRIKNRFDKEGISIPYPHRVIVQAND